MTNTTSPQQIVHRRVLNNGIVAIAIENPAADIIASRMFLRAGSQQEPLDKAGVAHLLSAVLTKGTAQLSSFEIAERVESVGASLGTDAATDYFLLSLKTISGDWPEMLQLAGDMLRAPSLPETEIELERYLTVQDIRSQKEQPFNIAFDRLRRAMYPAHPYGVSIMGTEETVSQLTREDLTHFHQTYFRPDNLVISVAGRITPDEAIRQIEAVFGDWQPPATPLPAPQLPSLIPQPHPMRTPQETQQSILMLGYLTPSVREADYATLKLLNTYLGNGLSSRLFVELREKRGLAYDVSAFYPTRESTSSFVTYMGTAPENTAIAYEGLYTEAERLRSQQLSAEELQTAKNKLLGQYALGKQTNAQLAQVYGWYETLKLGIEFDEQFQQAIDNITPEMAQAAAQRYLIEPYVSLVGPSEAIHALELPGE